MALEAAARTAWFALPRARKSHVAWPHGVAIVGLIAVTLSFRLYRLDDIPGELYGDIAIIHNFVNSILHGERSLRFYLSEGPLYGYTIAPLVAVLGEQGYLPYKLASVLISCVGVGLQFLLAWELSDFLLAAVAGFALGTSSWYLVFSRLGNSQILGPVITLGCLYCLVVGIKRHSLTWSAAGLVVASLGYYLYPETFVLPVSYILCVIFYLPRKQWLTLLSLAVLLTVPFLSIVTHQTDLFLTSSGYIGSKLTSSSDAIQKIMRNIAASVLMFHIRGDAEFRSNPPNMPQLDSISGLLFLLGAVYWSRRSRRHWLPLIVIPFVLLLVPANLVLDEAQPTPSASRTLAIVPLVMLVVAGGLCFVAEKLARWPWLQKSVLASVLAGVLILNWYRYFSAYAYNLPDHNTPYGKIIAEQIDALPPNVSALVYSCCWGSWGQPELAGIEDVLERPRQVMFLPAGWFSCDRLTGMQRPLYIVWDPREAGAATTPATCDPAAQVQHYYDPYGGEVFVGYYLPP